MKALDFLNGSRNFCRSLGPKSCAKDRHDRVTAIDKTVINDRLRTIAIAELGSNILSANGTERDAQGLTMSLVPLVDSRLYQTPVATDIGWPCDKNFEGGS